MRWALMVASVFYGITWLISEKGDMRKSKKGHFINIEIMTIIIYSCVVNFHSCVINFLPDDSVTFYVN